MKKSVLTGIVLASVLSFTPASSSAIDILNPANPASPTSPLNPSNPSNPASPLNPLHQNYHSSRVGEIIEIVPEEKNYLIGACLIAGGATAALAAYYILSRINRSF